MKQNHLQVAIIGANAFLLVVGAIAQNSNWPSRVVILSVVFLAWVALFIARIYVPKLVKA